MLDPFDQLNRHTEELLAQKQMLLVLAENHNLSTFFQTCLYSALHLHRFRILHSFFADIFGVIGERRVLDVPAARLHAQR